MTPIDIFRILFLVFFFGNTEGRVGCDAIPPTECWISHSRKPHMATAWLSINGIVYTTQEDR